MKLTDDCPRCGCPDVVFDDEENELSCRSCGYRTNEVEE
jgi:ribosomal protein S27AE